MNNELECPSLEDLLEFARSQGDTVYHPTHCNVCALAQYLTSTGVANAFVGLNIVHYVGEKSWFTIDKWMYAALVVPVYGGEHITRSFADLVISIEKQIPLRDAALEKARKQRG